MLTFSYEGLGWWRHRRLIDKARFARIVTRPSFNSQKTFPCRRSRACYHFLFSSYSISTSLFFMRWPFTSARTSKHIRVRSGTIISIIPDFLSLATLSSCYYRNTLPNFMLGPWPCLRCITSFQLPGQYSNFRFFTPGFRCRSPMIVSTNWRVEDTWTATTLWHYASFATVNVIIHHSWRRLLFGQLIVVA